MIGKVGLDNRYLVRVKTTTIDLNQAAGSYDLFTADEQGCALEGLIIKMPTGACGGSLTSIAIQTDDATPTVFISSGTGAVGNLTSEAQISWTGLAHIEDATKIQLTIAGGAHGSTYTCKVTALYRPIANGGILT